MLILASNSGEGDLPNSRLKPPAVPTVRDRLFVAGLRDFRSLRSPLGFGVSGAGLPVFSLLIPLSLIGFCLTGLRSSHGSLRLGETASRICGSIGR